MIGKLLPEILDKIDVFVLEVEELFLPKVSLISTLKALVEGISILSSDFYDVFRFIFASA
jgi:hypothetical protein